VVVKLSANKRKTGRTRKKERTRAGVELQDARPETKDFKREGEGPVEVESDKEEREKIESDMRWSEPEVTASAQFEGAEPQPLEQAEAELARQSKQTLVEPHKAEQESGGKKVAENREGIFDNWARVNESLFSLDGMKKAAAWYIETSEKLANQALELQERASGWAKDTPLAPLLEAQNSFARKFVERSANVARSLWQIQPTE
jgi:hypothetical protein